MPLVIKASDPDDLRKPLPPVDTYEEQKKLYEVLREKQRKEYEDQAKKYLVNQDGYELKPVQSQVKKMKVIKKTTYKFYDVIDQTPKKIDPEQLRKEMEKSNRNEVIKSKAQARSLLLEEYEKEKLQHEQRKQSNEKDNKYIQRIAEESYNNIK